VISCSRVVDLGHEEPILRSQKSSSTAPAAWTSWKEKSKKNKEVLTRFPHFRYKRHFILKLNSTTAYEKEIHFRIRVF
jgi:hypothetical protein